MLNSIKISIPLTQTIQIFTTPKLRAMYIYNVTINVDEAIHEHWLQWMQQEHIPEMLATGKFSKALMTKVLVEEEMGGLTYSVQYTTDSKETLERYYQEDAPLLRSRSKRFEGSFVAFRTELEIIGEYTNTSKYGS